MGQPLEEKVNQWTRDKSFGLVIQEVNSKLGLLEQELYREYEPTRGAHPSFRHRLGEWLANLPDEGD